MEIILTNNEEEILALVKKGYCPVECSINGTSIVDNLTMDHHGTLKDLESVAIRAYRDHFGARKEDPRFVLCGAADADASFAIAALAGIIPHPSRNGADIMELAKTIAVMDVAPVGVDLTTMPYGDYLLAFFALNVESRDTLGAYGAVTLWRNLLSGNKEMLDGLLEGSLKTEETRRTLAREDLKMAEEKGSVLFIPEAKVAGSDVWYGRNTEYPHTSKKGWKHPLLVYNFSGKKNYRISCPNNEVAIELFGEGGIGSMLSHLPQHGWGGRESIAGSPRGMELTLEDIHQVIEVVNKKIS